MNKLFETLDALIKTYANRPIPAWKIAASIVWLAAILLAIWMLVT